MSERVRLTRDCEGVQIPEGSKRKLPVGTEVTITQSLGGSYTVLTEEGFLVRIAGEDADALGKEAARVSEALAPQALKDPQEVEKLVWTQLRTCFDPEIPVNIVDLGLIYLCRVTPLSEDGNKVEIQMSLTAPGCGMGEVLRQEIQGKIQKLPGVREAKVDLVWDPPWNPARMSEAAKLQLGWF